ncbi:hypothetical protein RND81_09G119700 [Saponaria officinalis]|uniref:Uncharacterized protein n=1 Tax=Saponaria officinalis TaxID=3572 RepID=A0AAW1ILP9_SAPOF
MNLTPPPTNTTYVPPHRNQQFQPQPHWQNLFQNRPQQFQLRPPQQPQLQLEYQPQNSETAEIKALLQQHLAAQAINEAQINQLLAHNKMLYNQIGQLASAQQQRAPGTLPPTGESPHETANVIRTRAEFISDGFRVLSAGTSDRKLDQADLSSIEQETARPIHDEFDRTDEPEAKKQKPTRPNCSQLDRASISSTESAVTRLSGDPDEPKSTPKTNAVPIKIKLPYPEAQRRKTRVQLQFEKFLGVMKHLKVNVPFLDLFSHVPAYAKYMKDTLNRKRTTEDVKAVTFSEKSSEYLSRASPKLTDVPYAIGTLKINNVFCDLGASVSIIPYSVYKKLPKTPLRLTDVTLQQVDRTIIRPLGKIEDVPVQVGKFFIPIDFIVLDIPEDTHVPIILGRTFLHTAGALIDVGKWTLTFKVGEEKMVFWQSEIPRTAMQLVSVFAINTVVPSHDTKDKVEVSLVVVSNTEKTDDNSKAGLGEGVAEGTKKKRRRSKKKKDAKNREERKEPVVKKEETASVVKEVPNESRFRPVPADSPNVRWPNQFKPKDGMV